VPWAEEGWGSAKLDYLLSRFGFFFDDHRAMADCRAVLLQKAESIIICQINFSDGEENCFQLRSRSR
jgi:hypothetical protein